jgi:uncharacterized membrane protein HdeD (DUF308 family)
MPPQSQPSTPRRRLLLGVVLLILGACLLAHNLGWNVFGYLWDYGPFLLMAVGGLQLAWPGTWEERRSGFWVFVLGAWCAINIYEWFGLHWGNSWPIFIIALGIRVILSGVLRSRTDTPVPPGPNTGSST